MIEIIKTKLEHILAYRELYLDELNAQSRFHAYHQRGWTDSYLINLHDRPIGYVSVKGKETQEDRDTIFEFFIVPSFRINLYSIYRHILQHTGVRFIECQTNDALICSMLFECTQSISADRILFKEGSESNLKVPSQEFRKKHPDDKIFEHTSEPIGDYVLSLNGKIVATGGYLSHYNYPYVDLYMEVDPVRRKKGNGSFLIHELIAECRRNGRIAAARCDIKNLASKACLLKGGMQLAGYILTGTVIPNGLNFNEKLN